MLWKQNVCYLRVDFDHAKKVDEIQLTIPKIWCIKQKYFFHKKIPIFFTKIPLLFIGAKSISIFTGLTKIWDFVYTIPVFYAWRVEMHICNFSTKAILPNPQTSHPYSKIGFTILSNISYLQSIDILCFLHLLITLYISLVAFSQSSFTLRLNDPFLQKCTPRYIKLSTTSRLMSPFLNE